MSESCNQDCSSCSENCSDRKEAKTDFSEKLHDMSTVKKLLVLSVVRWSWQVTYYIHDCYYYE